MTTRTDIPLDHPRGNPCGTSTPACAGARRGVCPRAGLAMLWTAGTAMLLAANTGCNTVEGAAQDVKNLGKSAADTTERVFSDDPKND